MTHVPPDIVFPLEQSTIFTVVSKYKVEGVFPIAVTINLKLKNPSADEVNLTLFVS